MPAPLHAEVLAQIEALPLEAGRPLLISDADEVLTEFMIGLESYLERNGLYFDWSSFALTGNIRRKGDATVVASDEVRDHLKTFFARHTAELTPVPGAAGALAALARRTQIVVLTNVPFDQREARRRSLAGHGMDYPVVANVGAKGAAVRRLAERVDAPVFFVDDIPHNHSSVARAAAEVYRLHLIADPRLAELLGAAEDSHYRARDWEDARSFIERRLDDLGY